MSGNEGIPGYCQTIGGTPIALRLDSDVGIGFSGSASGINASGKIVGYVSTDDLGSVPVYWSSKDDAPIALRLDSDVVIGTDGSASGINASGQIVGSIQINGNSTPVYWSSKDDAPIALRLDSDVVIGTDGRASGINASGKIVGIITIVITDVREYSVYWPTSGSAPIKLSLTAYGINDSDVMVGNAVHIPTSNICFPAGTPIQTDQGIINIERIDTLKHTINQQTIRHITQTVTLDKYLISVGKSALGRNIPHQTTVMSKDHQIEFESRLVPAYRFLNFSKDVKKVKYSGEILYNILLDTHGRVSVNGLICETLHPENIIAKLYNNYSEGERYTIITQMNEALGERDVLTYKAVVNKVAVN